MGPTLLTILTTTLIPANEDWLDKLSDNLRWSIDESVRVIVDRNGDASTVAFFGLDLHKVISNESGDLATLNLQPYLTRIDNLDPHPPIFDGPDDWELIWRIFNANVKLRQDGALNLRVGHFELPFGLEYLVNTNGTLRDYIHGQNFGLKADWGVTLNGELDSLEYELAWSRGSGNEYRDEGDPGVISGRLGTDRDANDVYGISFVNGDFLTPGGILDRDRVALDAMFHRRALGMFAEVSAGSDGPDTDVLRALGEVNWRNSDETILAWLQLVSSDLDSSGDKTNSLDSRLGVQWRPATGWAYSVQYVQNLDPADSAAHRAGSFTFQLRYRF